MGCAAAAGAVVAGIADAVAAVGTFFAGVGGTIAGAVGLGDAALAGISAGGLIGAGLEGAAIGGLGGGLINAVTGKPILTGVGEGALLGGVTGLAAPLVGAATGLGAVGADALTGAAVGAGGSAVFGGNPLTGALTGAAGGAISGGLADAATPAGTASTGSVSGGGPGASAGALEAPASLGTDASILPDASVSPASGLPTVSPANSIAATTGLNTAPAASVNIPGAGSQPPFIGFTDAGSYDAVPSASPGGGTSTSTPAAAPAAGPDTATAGAIQAGLYPVPPVPPALDASGNPVFDASGSPTYPTATDASAAATNNAITTAGGIIPQQGGIAGVGQSVGLNGPAAGTLGYQISPTLGTDPTLPAPGGPGGTYTLAQGATTGTAAAPATGGGNSISSFIANPSLGTAGNVLTSNSSLLLGGALLGYDALKGNQQPQGEAQINTTANQLSAQATQLQSYLTSGTLPPGVATALQQAATSAQASIRSQYASRGMSGSSAEAADLANVQNTIVSQGANIAMSLLQQGVNEAGLASQLYGQIMQVSLAQDNQLSNALATLAGAAARPSVTVAGTTSP